MSNEAQSTQTILSGRFSYLNFHEPKAAPGSPKPKYSVCLLLDKSKPEEKAKAEAAIKAALVTKFGTKVPPGLKMPIRDGDDPRDNAKGRDEMKGHWFINCTSFDKPGIIDRDRNPILKREEIYSGMYGRVQVNFYYFDVGTNKGIACGLNNLQKIKDGENLSGRQKAEDAFADDAVFDDGDNDLD